MPARLTPVGRGLWFIVQTVALHIYASTFTFIPMAKRRKSDRYFRIFVFVTVVTGLLCILYLGALWWQSRQLRAVRYEAFGIPIPDGYQIHGIDVSRYQQRIAWESVRSMNVNGVMIGFAIIKATEGTDRVDPFFRRNWKKSKEAGMIRGAYHYFIHNKDGKVQAEKFIKAAELETGDLPPVLDVEAIGRTKPADLRKEVKKWLMTVEEHYSVRPIIYTNANFYDSYLSGHFDDYPLWVAHYLEPYEPRVNRDWTFWQHSEKGRVDGITSFVDFNVFKGDSLAFRSLLLP
jgi:lysozyme